MLIRVKVAASRVQPLHLGYRKRYLTTELCEIKKTSTFYNLHWWCWR